jgi:NAD(P)-dependent dehydrogenase (short-subunit alcohol dehydrogenase family)
MGSLIGNVAVITGGASGIGAATTRALAREGATVVVGDCQDAGPVIRDLEGQGGHASWLATDVCSSAQVQKLIAHAEEQHGRLDVLVTCAAIGGGNAPTADYAADDFERVIAVNLRGVFLAMKYAIAAMLRTGGGSIVNIASVLGLVGMARTPAYSAAKGGVVQLTKVAAVEYATRNIRVNCICPGIIDTPMARAPAVRQFAAQQPLGRLGAADEIARTAAFLAGTRAAFITGASFVIDGGFTAQ